MDHHSRPKLAWRPVCWKIILVATSFSRYYSLLIHLTPTRDGSFICNSILTAPSSTVSSTLLCAPSSLSPNIRSGSTLYRRKRVAITATNSTCANFLPGQFLCPSDHGKYVPCAGVKRHSAFTPASAGNEPVLIQRLGRQDKASAPQ